MKNPTMKGKKVTRKAMDTSRDPYISKNNAQDKALCSVCGSVYHNKRWYPAGEFKENELNVATTAVVCPACQKTRDGFPEGYVTISGTFKDDHRADIISLVRNKERIAMSRNPLDRIMEITDSDGDVVVTTTTERLAQSIGRMLKKSYHGEVEYRWSADTRIARVSWTR